MLNPSAKEFVPVSCLSTDATVVLQGPASTPISIGKPKTRASSSFRNEQFLAQTLANDCAAVVSEALSGLNCKCSELQFDEVFGASGVSRESSVASELDRTPSTEPVSSPFAAAAGNKADVTAVRDDPVEEAQSKLDQDGPVLASSCTENATTKVGPHDFEILRVVGQGAFGKVFQVRYKRTGEIYAMKVMRKEKILQRDHSEYVKSEKEVLTAVLHPYIVTLRFSFQTPSKLYLVLDFINGGHLFFNLYRQGVFSEDVARLYTAEIVLAIAYLHSSGIVHRDLKPENVLLDSDGHLKLTDFGLAKKHMDDNGRSNSFIGTMEYMAPEIVEGKGHDKAVDWWSTGILLYEMLCGVPPFRAKSRNALQNQILSAKVKFPKFLSSESQSLLKSLLTRDPNKRLGCGPAGSDNIKKHAFFRTINWAKLEKREVESKFKPMVKSVLSVENFDKIWTDQPPEDSPCGTPTADEVFHGFSYVAPSFLAERMETKAIPTLTQQTAA